MNEAGILTTILLLGVVIGFFIMILIKNVVAGVETIKAIFKNNRSFSNKKKKVAEMRAGGELHEWISIPTTNGELLVCKKTGYIPSIDGFMPMQAVNAYVSKVQQEEEYREFRNKRVAALANELNLNLGRMEEVVEKIFSMRKDFALLQLEKLQRELEEKAKNA